LNDPDLKERLIEIQRVDAWSLHHIVQFCLATETRVIVFLDPNLQTAQKLALSFDEAKERFLQSLDIDYGALTTLGQQLISELKGAKEIHLTSPKGTDLYFSAGERPWANDDGISPRPAGVTPYIGNLPVGEVFAAPIEDSARGTLFPENIPGVPVRDLRIEFRGNEPAQLSAEEGLDYLSAILENATGFPYCIAEFAIGTNPCGDPVLATEKAYGTAHVAIGQNTWLGGENECSVHVDFLVDKPTVTVDGKCILKDGEFAL
jgi:leucyl aminopeptidase (aminopeptidase T)